MDKVGSSKDFLMLLFYAKGHKKQCEPIRGRTRIMKMVFLFNKEVRKKFNLSKVIPKNVLPDFTPYDYGPFSSQVFDDLEFLVELGFVQVTRIGDQDMLPEEALEYEYWQAGNYPDEEQGYLAEESFSLTEVGKEFVQKGEAGKLNNEQWSVLNEFKARCTGVSLRALLRYVYAKYSGMTTESKIRDEILSEYEF